MPPPRRKELFGYSRARSTFEFETLLKHHAFNSVKPPAGAVSGNLKQVSDSTRSFLLVFAYVRNPSSGTESSIIRYLQHKQS